MNWTNLLAALCLVLVIEGLFLLVAPNAWKRVAMRMLATSESAMRAFGGLMVVAGLVALQLMRAG